MAKKETAGGGVERMDPELAFAGFEPDPIDDEDFSDADRGHELADEVTVEAQRQANEEAGEGEPDIPVVDKTGQSEADGDEDAVDAAEAKAAADKARAEEAEQAEPEQAAEAEPEQAAEAEQEDSKPKGQMIPKSRFDEVNERRKKAEEELARMRAQAEAAEQGEAEEFDFEAKEMEYMNLVLEGEHNAAAKLRSEIRAAERASFQKDASTVSNVSIQEASDRQAIEAYSAQIIAEYPAFDHTDETNFRSDLLEDVGLHTNLYVEKGLSRPKAFERAVQDVIKLNDLTSIVKGEDPKPNGKAPERRTTAKKVEAAAAQPANIADAGRSSSEAGLAKVDINKISDSDLEKLPAETLARLRGDYV